MIAVLIVAGMFTLGLGTWHLGVPRWFYVATAIGPDSPDSTPLRPIGVRVVRRAVVQADRVDRPGVRDRRPERHVVERPEDRPRPRELTVHLPYRR